ncbi:hypothetical protein M422DRAFT_274333 [Sphaerobolus stellatus SS14]|uniref:Uncharacterized protein n=1 Tax=Sphaerobolus stellatus (strain SS14) TaxID=990650 RepID=A0A0C9T765_SPHS4|nr:hypothetical protein M422DRAFT_274333 [Sphaerobolus stellatus SS14]
MISAVKYELEEKVRIEHLSKSAYSTYILVQWEIRTLMPADGGHKSTSARFTMTILTVNNLTLAIVHTIHHSHFVDGDTAISRPHVSIYTPYSPYNYFKVCNVYLKLQPDHQ